MSTILCLHSRSLIIFNRLFWIKNLHLFHIEWSAVSRVMLNVLLLVSSTCFWLLRDTEKLGVAWPATEINQPLNELWIWRALSHSCIWESNVEDRTLWYNQVISPFTWKYWQLGIPEFKKVILYSLIVDVFPPPPLIAIIPILGLGFQRVAKNEKLTQWILGGYPQSGFNEEDCYKMTCQFFYPESSDFKNT